MRTRLTPDDRKVAIILAAMRVAACNPTKPLRRADVAKEAGCAQSLITHYFGKMSEVEKAAILQSITVGDFAALAYAVAQGLPGGDKNQRMVAASHLVS